MSAEAVAHEEAVRDEKSEEYKLVRPTLFIGLGGTGAAILTALRRRILQRLWNRHRLESIDDFKVASFLYFDTFAGQAKDQEARRSENDPEDPIAPLVALQRADSIQAGLDPAKYLKKNPLRGTAELDNYPTVKAWLPAEELTAINLEEGAGQIRAMSRLLFFDRFQELQGQVSSRLRLLRQNLSEQDQLRRLGLETTSKVNVKIIGSAAGGTGSGTFIDAGYLASSLRDPQPDEVSLWLVLGGAFAGQGPRVLANTYAALSEIEYAMKLRHGDAPFVETWDGRFKPEAIRPYSRLYLFDSINTAELGVNQQGRDHIFRMIADLLLQEFAEPDLVGARRGDQSNQDTKYREPMYRPVVTRQFGDQGLQYSRLYSGIGQSSIETRGRIEFQAQSAEVAIAMLKAYFRIDDAQATAPQAAAVDEFMAEKLFLGPARQFTVHKDLRSQPVLSDYPIVYGHLLAKSGNSLLESVQKDVEKDFQEIILSPMAEWPERVQRVARNRMAEIDQDPTKENLTIRLRNVEDARRVLTAELTAPDSAVRRGILGLIDSDTGGIAYAEQFVEAMKASIAGRWIPRFKQDADTFRDLASHVLDQLYAQAAQNLQKESRGSMFSSPNRQRMQTIVYQLQDTLIVWMQYRLRQIACTKAAEVLTAVNAALGEAVGVGQGGRPQYSGVLRDISEGFATIEETIADLEREAKLIRDPDTARNPIYQVIGSAKDAPPLTIGVDGYRAIAVKAFEKYGGASQLFVELRDKRKRAQVLNRIRSVASEETGPQGKPILPTEAEVPSLIDELARLPRNQQEEILGRAVKQAQAWVNIGKVAGYTDDMNSMFVCVADPERFHAMFGDIVRRAASPYLGAKEISYIPSTTQGKLAFCTELSGVPLDAMKQLHDDWLRQYDEVREDPQQAPLHTHKFWEKFARPTAPDTAEMQKSLDDLGLFVQGVAFGVLRRRSKKRYRTAPDKVGQYEINLATGMIGSNWVPIGRELKIRNFNIKDDQRPPIEDQLRDFTEGLAPVQYLAAIALFDYYQHRHYAPSLFGADETQHAGMGHLACGRLIENYKKRMKETPEGLALCGADGERLPAPVRALSKILDEWTEIVEDSLDDVDNTEANKDPDADPERRSLPKRTLRLDVFRDVERLRALALGKPAQPVAAAAVAVSSGNGAGQLYWYVGPEGKPLNRLVDHSVIAKLAGDGIVTGDTKICAKGTKKWIPAAEWPEFTELFQVAPPLDDETAPPMN